MMKRHIIFLLCLAVFVIMTSAAGCSSDLKKGSESSAEAGLSSAGQMNAEGGNAEEAKVNGNTVVYGSHSYTVKGSIANGETAMTFTNVPANYAEFEAVYHALLGKSIEGTVGMIPMVMEVYARDKAEGEKCIELLCGEENTSTMIRSLQSKFSATSANANDPYLRRYLPAALLAGATAENGYAPTMPYTVNMKQSVNKPQPLTGKGMVTYVYILAPGGWDTAQRSVEILKRKDSEYHTVFNCPAVYTQCKEIEGTWNGLK